MKRAPRIGFGIANFLLAAGVAWAVFRALPTRWWLVDSGGALVITLMSVSGGMLLLEHDLAERVTRIASGVTLAAGLALFGALVTSASWLWGTYGAIGRGGASIFIIVCVMVFPYLIAYPAAELLWVGPRRKKRVVTLRELGRLFAAYAALLLVVFIAVHQHASLSPITPVEIRSTWANGKLVARGEGPIVETAIAESPISWGYLTAALVAARDGVRADLDGKTAWVTPDDLLSAQAYDFAPVIDPAFGVGTDESHVLALLALRFDVPAREVKQRAVLHRVRFARARLPIDGATLTREQVIEGVRGAAKYLARNCDENGRFRYMVRATTNQSLPGYNWPRHSGTTYFLAQAAALLDDPEIRYAALRAASLTRDTMMNKCGENKCVSDQRTAEVGSTALAMIAFAELVTTGADPSFARPLGELAAFLRSQQRPDGELMHEYDRDKHSPIDIQRLYYSGEGALGLSRAHLVLGDPRDLEAAKRITAHLAGTGWTFFGSRYFYGEEHWTCQVVADLWSRAPDREAADFCLRWHEYQRALQRDAGDSAFDDDGAFGFGPFTSPRVTPASSRGEAAGAALFFVRQSPEQFGPAVDRALSNELDRALAFVLRQQLVSGMHLYANPEAVRGAIPGSPVDMDLRIDYAQHAGSMMVRWLALHGTTKSETK